MSKRNIDKQVYEQYVDATVALFMEHYAAALTDATLQTQTPAQTCSEMLDLRCMTAIRKAYAKRRTRAFWKGTKKVLSSAAIVLVALLSLSSLLFMTVEAFRVPVINFFIEQGDGFWAITGRSEEGPIDPIVSNEFDPHDPLAGLLPEGYTVITQDGDMRTGLYALYQAPDGSRVIFSVRTNSIDITLDSENAAVSRNFQVMEHAGVFVVKDDFPQLAWVDKTARISYLLSADTLSENEIFYIADEIMKKISK